MRNFNPEKKFGNRGGFGDRDGGRITLHQATCSDCGAPCEVPFRPTPGKPVYCNNCFKKEGGDNRFEKRDFGKKSFGDRRGGFGKPSFGDRGDRQMFEATCAECGNRCEVPFKPTGEKPVYCSNCFGGKNENRGPRSSGGSTGGGAGVSREQFDQLNAKLDKIIKELDILKQKKSFTVEKQVKKPEEPKMGKVVEKAEDKKPVEKKTAKTVKKKIKK